MRDDNTQSKQDSAIGRGDHSVEVPNGCRRQEVTMIMTWILASTRMRRLGYHMQWPRIHTITDTGDQGRPPTALQQ